MTDRIVRYIPVALAVALFGVSFYTFRLMLISSLPVLYCDGAAVDTITTDRYAILAIYCAILAVASVATMFVAGEAQRLSTTTVAILTVPLVIMGLGMLSL